MCKFLNVIRGTLLVAGIAIYGSATEVSAQSCSGSASGACKVEVNCSVTYLTKAKACCAKCTATGSGPSENDFNNAIRCEGLTCGKSVQNPCNFVIPSQFTWKVSDSDPCSVDRAKARAGYAASWSVSCYDITKGGGGTGGTGPGTVGGGGSPLLPKIASSSTTSTATVAVTDFSKLTGGTVTSSFTSDPTDAASTTTTTKQSGSTVAQPSQY